MNGSVTTLKVLVAIIALASAPLVLKRRWRLFLALPISAFQIFLPGLSIANTPIPVAFFGSLMLWPEFVREFKVLVSWKPTVALLGIIAMYAVSLTWSPTPKLGLPPIGYTLQFLTIFAATLAEARRNRPLVLRLLVVTLGFTLVQAVAVIVFRVMPGLKLTYLTSPLARFFISPKVVGQLFTTGVNNVVDPTKSGGILAVNANVGAIFLGMCAFVAAGLALDLRKRWLAVLAVVFFTAIAFAGSKAALLIEVGLTIISLHIISMRITHWRVRTRVSMLAVVLLATIVWLTPKALSVSQGLEYKQLSLFASRSQATLSTREKIWAYGAKAFSEHPFLGQGFGGWQDDFPRYARKVGLDPDLPPHNTIIYLWSQGSILAAILGLWYIYGILNLGQRLVFNGEISDLGINLGMSMAFLWLFLQGMGENIGLVGDGAPLLAGLLAIGCVNRERMADRVDQTIRRGITVSDVA